MANLLCYLALFLVPTSLFAAEPGEIDLAGWVKNAEGTYTKAFSDSNGTSKVTLNSPPTTLSTTSTALVNTSKGVQSFDITKTADVDVSRVGKAVRGLAVLGGPVGMAVTAASLVCELSEICNLAGQWMLGADPALEGFPTTTPNYKWNGYNQETFPSPFTACNSPGYLAYRGAASASPVMVNEGYYDCGFKSAQGAAIAGWTPRLPGCAGNYVLSGSQCVLQGNAESRAPTATDWDSKESLLNDQRFIDPLVTGNHPVPIQSPTIPTPIKKPISKETTTIKDGAGNTTGTETTETEAEISDPSPAENPSNNPNLIKISETTIKNTYNLNNQLTNSTTTVNDGAQQPQPQQIKIDIDDMQDTPLQNYQVPVTFAYDSWGSGTCPADRSVEYHYGSLNLTFQPACDFAVGIQPVILVVAGMIAMFIVSGVRLND